MNKNKKSKIKEKGHNKYLYLLIILCIMILTFVYFSYKDIIDKDSNSTGISNKEVETYEASLLAVGDIMVHSPQLNAQYDSSTDSYNFENNFKYVKKYIKEADYSLANLETTLAGDDVYPYSSYPMFNSPDELADALKDVGFDLLSTINNHSFDKGNLGVDRTLSTLKKKGFDTVGTRENISDDDYIIKNINDIEFGITSYSYGDIKNDNKYLNGIKISEESEDKMNVFNSSNVDSAFDTIYSTVKKMDNTDMQIVILHWGIEYSRSETDFQKQLAQKLCDAGVDIIIGSHPHVVQPVETITSTDNKNETLVIYSLGNYISNQRRDTVGLYSEDGLMVNINISKKSNEDEAKIEKVVCIPTWVNKYHNGYKYVYEIIPIEDEGDLNSIASLNKNNVKQSYNNTASLIDDSDIIKVTSSPFN